MQNTEYKYSVGANAVEDRIATLKTKKLRDNLTRLLRDRWAGAWFIFPKNIHKATPVVNRFMFEFNQEMKEYLSPDDITEFWKPLFCQKAFYVRTPKDEV